MKALFSTLVFDYDERPPELVESQRRLFTHLAATTCDYERCAYASVDTGTKFLIRNVDQERLILGTGF